MRSAKLTIDDSVLSPLFFMISLPIPSLNLFQIFSILKTTEFMPGSFHDTRKSTWCPNIYKHLY